MFICLEGADGCGKSTIGRRLAEKISADYREIPDRTTVSGKVIDAWLHGDRAFCWWQKPSEHTFRSEENQWQSFAAGTNRHDRSTGLPEHAIVLQSLITVNKLEALPWLAERMLVGHNVVFSRWTPSAIAYGGADGCDVQWLKDIHRGVYEPDLCILLDVPIETALARIGARAENYETPARIARVSSLYRQIWSDRRSNGYGNWVSVDAARPLDKVFAEVMDWYEARRVDSLRR